MPRSFRLLPALFLLFLSFLGIPSSSAVAQEAEPPVDPVQFQQMEWRNIGPFRGGRSVAAAGVVQDPMTYYFGGVGSGVWKTTDAGTTWENVSDTTFGTASVGAIAVAPSDPNVVYVGMGEHAVRGVMTSHGDGVYKSTDAGKTWTHVGLPGSRAIARIQVHPENPDVVYVAVQGAPYGPTEERGVYRSADGGATWEQVLYVSETAGASDLSLDPSNPRVLYASFWDHLRQPWEVRSGGDGSGLWKSTDGGDTWTAINEGLPELIGKTGIAVSADPERVYAIIEADPEGGLYRSDDAGQTWTLVNDTWAIKTRAWYYMNVYADPQNPDVVWVLNAPAMKSIDGGKTFERIRTPHGDNHDLWIHPDNSNFVINANDGGANVSVNGGRTWSTQQNQPTAQFYRVNTDNRFPYWVYSGQQDNSPVAIRSQAPGSGIGWKDWTSAAGCETAYVAFDKDNPARNYGGCYMGIIGEYDLATEAERNVMAYPVLPAALAARDMKYRYNWNAPILVSLHDPNVLYHAANVLLKSTDRGVTWTEISEDLTRDEDTKQGYGGRPITNEGAGGETYNTIMYVAESPLDGDVLWAGSDDGLIHVTRDGGTSWTDVTPPDLPEAMINAIDASPHDPAVAYAAVTRYKVNDFTPHIFRTTDYGRTWTRLVDGIADEHHVRVVREDPVRRGLLYAGTEGGLYVSWDDGARWQPLQLGMPITPITDLQVQRQHNDLVAATQGRGFWILDRLEPLQQMAPALDAVTLFGPGAAYRVAGGEGASRDVPGEGKNPMPGATVDFYVADLTDSSAVTVEILNEAGEVVRTYTNQKGDDVDGTTIEVEAGHNRMSWDLRHEAITSVPGFYVFGSLRGRRVIPGAYQVRLTSDGAVQPQPLQVLPDPRLEADPAGFREQDALAAAVAADLDAIHQAVLDIRDVRSQIEAFVARAEGQEAEELVATAEDLMDRLTALEDTLIQKRTVDGQTVINFPSRLNFQYTFLHMAVDGAEGVVTDGARTHYADLTARWTRHRAALEQLMGPDLDAFNAAVRASAVPPVIAPERAAGGSMSSGDR